MNMPAVVIGLLLAFLAQTGCSVYKAASQPGPADLNGIGVGSRRTEVITRLGAPRFSDTDQNGQKQDTFEFQSGFIKHPRQESSSMLQQMSLLYAWLSSFCGRWN